MLIKFLKLRQKKLFGKNKLTYMHIFITGIAGFLGSNLSDYYLKKKYKGIILEMSGLGHVPTTRARKSWIKKLKEVQKKGLIICAAAQTIYGKLDPLVYSNGRELLKTGIIYLEDMLAETALVKLGWVLGHSKWAKDKEIVKKKMLENFSGELNNRLEINF